MALTREQKMAGAETRVREQVAGKHFFDAASHSFPSDFL